MKRDFCIADMFMPRKRLLLDPRTWKPLYFLERSTNLFLSFGFLVFDDTTYLSYEQ